MLAREAAGWGRVDMNTPTAELPEGAKGWCESAGAMQLSGKVTLHRIQGWRFTRRLRWRR